MKKIIITAIFATIFSIGAYAQKYALVDMEYILKNIPQYEMANEQLNQVSLRWQRKRGGRAAGKIFRTSRRTLQETPITDGTDTKRHL